MENRHVTCSVFVVRNIHQRPIAALVADSPSGAPEVLPHVIAFASRLATEGVSLSRIRAFVTTLGFLHDHLTLIQRDKPLSPESLPDAIHRFLLDRRSGIQSDDGSLVWNPVKIETIKRDRQALKAYSDFCAERFGHFPIISNSTLPFATGGQAHRAILAEVSKRTRLLSHLEARRPLPSIPGVSLGEIPLFRSPSRRSVLTKRMVVELIESTKSDVHKLVFIQAAFGGQRISEILHTWRCDLLDGVRRPSLFPDDKASAVPLLVLAHPSQGRFTGDIFDFSKDRRQHLKARGLTPRHLMEGDPLHSGWKGLSMDNQSLLISQVFWSDRTWAQIYAELFRKVRERISRNVQPSISQAHPYIIVNDDASRSCFGQPMKMPNILKAYNRAIEKLDVDRAVYRTGLHGLRHFYKASLESMGLSPEQIRIAMHHKSAASQNNYGAASAQLNSALNAAMVAIEKQRNAP